MNKFFLILNTFPEECAQGEQSFLMCSCDRCTSSAEDEERAEKLGYKLEDAVTSYHQDSFFWEVSEEFYRQFEDWPNLFTGDQEDAEDSGLEA